LEEALDKLLEFAPEEAGNINTFRPEIVDHILNNSGPATNSILSTVQYASVITPEQIMAENALLTPCQQAVAVTSVDVVFLCVGLLGIRIPSEGKASLYIIKGIDSKAFDVIQMIIEGLQLLTTTAEVLYQIGKLFKTIYEMGLMSMLLQYFKNEMRWFEWVKTCATLILQITSWFATGGAAFFATMGLNVIGVGKVVQDSIDVHAKCTCGAGDSKKCEDTAAPVRGGTNYVENFPQVFNRISNFGKSRKITGITNYISPAYHPQGIGYYKDRFYITHNDTGSDGGLIYVVDAKTGKYVKTIKTKTGRFNHPGGCQIDGNFLMVPIQEHTFVSQKYEDNLLCAMNLDTGAVVLKDERRDFSTAACGVAECTMPGGVRGYVAVCIDNDNIFRFYAGTSIKGMTYRKSNIKHKSYAVEKTFGNQPQGLFLFATNEPDTLYLVESASNAGLYLSRIVMRKVSKDAIDVSVTPVSERILKFADPDDGKHVSFKYSCCVYAVNKDTLAVFATGGHNGSGKYIYLCETVPMG